MEGQVRERCAEDPGGGGDPARQAAGGDRRPFHVSQHPGFQVTTAYQGLPHRAFRHLPTEVGFKLKRAGPAVF